MNKKLYFISFSLLSLSLASCNKVPDGNFVLVSSVSSPVSIHTEEQNTILELEDPNAYMSNKSTVYGLRSWSKPNGIHLTWSEDNKEGYRATRYNIYLGEDRTFSNPIIYETGDQEIDIYNMKINTTYYYKVEAYYQKMGGHYETFNSETKSFTVEDVAPRNLFIDGLENCRDLGGWDIGDNRTYKQGMIYRTVQYNYGGGLNTTKFEPTEYGKWQLTKELGIKTEIDLRKTISFNGEDEVNGITSSPLGSSVKYVSAPMIYGSKNIFTRSENKSSVQLVFDTLADISNYPVSFHCVRGTDRTGAIAYIIGALVGMNEKDLMMDYLLSNLAKIGSMVKSDIIEADDFYVKGIANSSGESLSEKARNYLHETCEVPYTTIDSVISNLVV